MGIGTPSDDFACNIYLPRRQPEREWILDICQTFWRHSMNFVSNQVMFGTWEEQLHTAIHGETLSHQIDNLVGSGLDSLHCYDRRVCFYQ